MLPLPRGRGSVRSIVDTEPRALTSGSLIPQGRSSLPFHEVSVIPDGVLFHAR